MDYGFCALTLIHCIFQGSINVVYPLCTISVSHVFEVSRMPLVVLVTSWSHNDEKAIRTGTLLAYLLYGEFF